MQLKPGQWYWIRRRDGSLAPYRFHRRVDGEDRELGEFYVGSLLEQWPLGRVVGEAQMPTDETKRR